MFQNDCSFCIHKFSQNVIFKAKTKKTEKTVSKEIAQLKGGSIAGGDNFYFSEEPLLITPVSAS